MKKRRALWGKAALHFVLILFAVAMLIPFYWMIMNSFKSTGDFYSKTTGLFVDNPVWDNYVNLFTATETPRWFFNSFSISVLTTGIGIFICSLAGFAFGAYKFKFRGLLFWIVLGSVAIPDVVTIIPVFKMMINIKLIDTYVSVVMPYAISMFGIFMMKQYIASCLPKELIEAARIDGLTEVGIYARVALPLIRPALGVLGIYLWLNSWSGYFWPFIMLKSKEMMTLPVGFATLYADPYNLQYGMLMAGSLLSTIPIVIIFLAAQEQFIVGLTTGAVKG